jgi:hypothetical protein
MYVLFPHVRRGAGFFWHQPRHLLGQFRDAIVVLLFHNGRVGLVGGGQAAAAADADADAATAAIAGSPAVRDCRTVLSWSSVRGTLAHLVFLPPLPTWARVSRLLFLFVAPLFFLSLL